MTILFMNSRNRTPSQIVVYGYYLYFLGLSFRNTANKSLSFLKNNKNRPRTNLALDTKLQTKEISKE
jgi:hypothetical protein